MNHSKLKRFSAYSRERLLAVTDENTAYISFMRLCAAAFVCPQFISQLNNMSLNERHSAFAEKCREYCGVYGGVFNSSHVNVEYPEVLLTDILSDISEIPLNGDDILSWLHQYYNDPYRDSLAAGLKKSKRLKQADIAPATQVFTPDWIVRYLVENTLVRRWYEGGGTKTDGFDSYIFGDMAQSAPVRIEEMKFLDPCAGCGNILLYAFDAFMAMYRSQGYSEKSAADMILQNNLFGLELDERACAVAVTSLRIKSTRYGSWCCPEVFNFRSGDVENFAGSLASANNCSGNAKKVLSMKFDAIATNPPYLGHSAMDSKLHGFVQKYYKDYSSDLFVTFTARSCELVKPDGRLGFLTPYTWLFIRTCEPLRRLLLEQKSLDTLVQLEYSAFDTAVVPLCMFTFSNSHDDRKCCFLRLTDQKGDLEYQHQLTVNGIKNKNCSYRYTVKADDFLSIPTAPIIYWLSSNMRKCFDLPPLSDTADIREGLITGDNERFLRRWYEVSDSRTAFVYDSEKKWYPLNKGGDFRKWYGNQEYVINWENDGSEIKCFRDRKGKLLSRPQNVEYNFRFSVSWSALTSGRFAVRYYDDSFIFNVAGGCAFSTDFNHLIWLLAILNSKVTSVLTQALNPTMNMNPGDTARLPMPKYRKNPYIQQLAEKCVELSRQDWDSFETSYGFKRHPLI